MFVNSDFSDLLRIFNANHVKYLVIGGYAVVQYAEPRFTKDLDIWINTEAANAEAIFKSLREFGAPLENLSVKNFSEEGYFFKWASHPFLWISSLVSLERISRNAGKGGMKWNLMI